MKDIVIGIFFISVGALFGSISLTYQIGTLAQMGPGYFPLIFSIALVVLGAFSLLRKALNGRN